MPILVDSGIDKLDNAKFYSNGTWVLEAVLSDAERYALKWVFCADEFYVPTLIKHGFVKIDAYNDSRVEIYEYEPLEIASVSPEPDFPLMQIVIHGIVPMLNFVLMLIFLAWKLKHRLYRIMRSWWSV